MSVSVCPRKPEPQGRQKQNLDIVGRIDGEVCVRRSAPLVRSLHGSDIPMGNICNQPMGTVTVRVGCG